METHVFRPECLFLSVLCVNGIMTIGLTGAQEVSICNESLMLQNLPECGKYFEEMMHKVDSKKWCDIKEFVLTLESKAL
ncbi:receptor activity-modifying protein 3 isoform X4 [Anolis carolinensis]|uniref:receptor activity-modifying protein 3 isoform X4 n=1 Tax=Anolis carolinensis TaxID=28377 RepID=UPI002F2B5C98